MKLSSEEVRKIAQLARVEVTAAEEDRYAETISAVLEYMKILNEVETDHVEPTFQVTGLHDIVREDTVVAAAPGVRQKLISQMPAVEMEELEVPGVFSGD